MQMRAKTASESVLPVVFRDGRILKGIAQLCFVLIVVLLLNDFEYAYQHRAGSNQPVPQF